MKKLNLPKREDVEDYLQELHNDIKFYRDRIERSVSTLNDLTAELAWAELLLSRCEK